MAMAASSSYGSNEIGEAMKPPWLAARVALTHAIGHHWRICELLHDLGIDRYPICSLAVTKMGHRKWSTGRWLGRRLAMVKVSSSEASTSRSSATSRSRPPHAPRPVPWLQSMKTTHIWWRLGFNGFLVLQAKIHAMGCTIYRSF
jgi:hypothetical protein